jgi:hypothetical protein
VSSGTTSLLLTRDRLHFPVNPKTSSTTSAASILLKLSHFCGDLHLCDCTSTAILPLGQIKESIGISVHSAVPCPVSSRSRCGPLRQCPIVCAMSPICIIRRRANSPCTVAVLRYLLPRYRQRQPPLRNGARTIPLPRHVRRGNKKTSTAWAVFSHISRRDVILTRGTLFSGIFLSRTGSIAARKRELGAEGAKVLLWYSICQQQLNYFDYSFVCFRYAASRFAKRYRR